MGQVPAREETSASATASSDSPSRNSSSVVPPRGVERVNGPTHSRNIPSEVYLSSSVFRGPTPVREPAIPWWTHGLPPPRPGISSSGTQALNQRRDRARTVAVPDPAVSGAPARTAGHRPLNIRPGRRHRSPPVSRSQAARAATGPLMRTFPGKLPTAPGRFSGGGAGGGAGFRSSPPATSERDHSTR